MRLSFAVRLVASFSAVLLLAPAVSAQSITLNQIDNFNGGTTLNWMNGAGNATAPTGGGPGGAGDGYLDIIADGTQAGGRLTVFNRAQWTGNYNAAGVNAIEMDLRNFSTEPLSIRIAFKTSTTANAPGYSSANGFALPVSTQWQHAVFFLDNSTMAPVNGPAMTLPQLLAAAPELRILHATTPSINGDFITGRVGIDNVRASFIPIPEPACLLALAAAGAGAVGPLLRRRRRRTATPTR